MANYEVILLFKNAYFPRDSLTDYFILVTVGTHIKINENAAWIIYKLSTYSVT